jgi:hypothetical protein
VQRLALDFLGAERYADGSSVEDGDYLDPAVSGA